MIVVDKSGIKIPLMSISLGTEESLLLLSWSRTCSEITQCITLPSIMFKSLRVHASAFKIRPLKMNRTFFADSYSKGKHFLNKYKVQIWIMV